MTPIPATANDYLWVTIVGGAGGAAAMYGVVRALNVFGWVKGDIILAIGEIFLHRRKNAFQLGLLLHIGSSVAFAAAQMVMIAGLPFTALRDTIWSHPTMVEGFNTVFGA